MYLQPNTAEVKYASGTAEEDTLKFWIAEVLKKRCGILSQYLPRPGARFAINQISLNPKTTVVSDAFRFRLNGVIRLCGASCYLYGRNKPDLIEVNCFFSVS